VDLEASLCGVVRQEGAVPAIVQVVERLGVLEAELPDGGARVRDAPEGDSAVFHQPKII
jgi:hypothetical protein